MWISEAGTIHRWFFFLFQVDWTGLFISWLLFCVVRFLWFFTHVLMTSVTYGMFKSLCKVTFDLYHGASKKKKVKLSPNRQLRPIWFWNVKVPILYRQSAHRWRQGCQPYGPAALYCPETLFFYFWYSFMLEEEWTPGHRSAGRIT
jgi:hypothetical protein